MNTGASWPGPVEAESRVLAMQTKLHQWATADPGRRFRAWLDEADIRTGAMFRRMDGSHGVSDKRMTERAIRMLVTRRARDARISGASFRPLVMGRRSQSAPASTRSDR